MPITPDSGPWKHGEWTVKEEKQVRDAIDLHPDVFPKGIAITLARRLRRTPEAVRMKTVQIRKELRMKEWIPVTEYIPPPDLAVLVARHHGTVVSMDAKFENGKWIRGEDANITHWMHLPEPPVSGSAYIAGKQKEKK